MSVLHLRVCTVDLGTGWVDRGNERERLSATERRLLEWFVGHGGRVVARQELLREVWHWHARRNTRAVDIAVRRLRARIERNPQEPDHLFTVHGIGFRFVPLRAEAAANSGEEVPELSLVHEALSRGRSVEVLASEAGEGTRLARALLAGEGKGLRARVDLQGCPLELLSIRIGEAIEPGAATDPDRLHHVLRAAGEVLLVLDHAEPEQVAALERWVPPNTRVVWIGRALSGVERIVLSRRDAAPPSPSEGLGSDAQAALARLRHARGGLPDALAKSALGPATDALPILRSRRLVEHNEGRWRVGASSAGAHPDPDWLAWLRAESESHLARWRRYEEHAVRPLLVWLGEQLHAVLAAGDARSADWLVVAALAESLAARDWSRIAHDEAVAAAEAGPPAQLALALVQRATHFGDPADSARLHALGVPDAELGLWPALCAQAAASRDYDAEAAEAVAHTLPALAEAQGRLDVARSSLEHAAAVAQWRGRPANAGRYFAELAALCARTGYPHFAARYGASCLLVRAETPDDDHPHDEIDELLRAIRAPGAPAVAPHELIMLGSVLWRAERDAEALALLAEARESAHRQGLRATELAALNNLGVADWFDGKWGRAAQRFQAGLVIANTMESRGYRAILLLNLASTLEEEDGLEEADRLAAGRPDTQALVTRRRLLFRSAAAAPERALAAAWASSRTAAEQAETQLFAGVLALNCGDRPAAEAAFAARLPMFLAARVARAFLARALRRGA